jgi:tryptophan synthase alpha chain
VDRSEGQRWVVRIRDWVFEPGVILEALRESWQAQLAFGELWLAWILRNDDTRPLMNRIEERFAALRKAGRKGLIVYIAAGDPDLVRTCDLALAFDRVGVDFLELGVPFSDPLADGVVNQLAAQRGLASGTTLTGVLEMVSTIRRQSTIPIILYLYYNLAHRHGLERFIRESAAAGVDGLLILDLPYEEANEYESLMQVAGLSNIYLLAPTTPDARLTAIARRARGFLYYVSREGVTGMQSAVATDLDVQLARIRSQSNLPIAVGFGISNPDQARAVARSADAVVVGSAVVDQIGRLGHAPDMVARVTTLVQSLVEAVKTVAS